jgi:ABC-2 type transport system ATP-binding protein
MSIRVSGLSKKFGDFTAVYPLDLVVPSGCMHGFLGPNGSGKSTTVRMLTGLLPSTSGQALINGFDVSKDPVAVRQTSGVLPEQLALFDKLTLWEHLEVAGPLYSLSMVETRARATQLFRYLDLFQERHTYASQASFGMRKKTALALALLPNPKTLFLDEPFEGIDPSSAENIRQLLIQVAAKGTTIFITSHMLEVVENLVQTYSILNGGLIVASGCIGDGSSHTLKEIYFEHIPRPAAEEFEWLG